MITALSIHADYRCRNSGLCCSVDWDVPMELPVYRSLTDAVARGALQPAVAGDPFITGPDLPEDAAAIFQRTPEGQCVFLDRDSRLCRVHRDLGEPALAVTCRSFPRLALTDARGTSITLSHFCPTAASLLFREDVPLGIVTSPAAFPPADYEGLSVGSEDLPPFLHGRMLMDLDGYAAWEQHMVARCADATVSPESVVATLARDVEALARWRPSQRTLVEAVRMLPPALVDAPTEPSLGRSLERFVGVLHAVPEAFMPDPDEDDLVPAYERFVVPRWAAFSRPIDYFLAAKAFASWTAYQGTGLATIVAGLDAALGLVRVEAARQCRDAGRPLDADLLRDAFRAADFLLNHLAVGDALAAAWDHHA